MLSSLQSKNRKVGRSASGLEKCSTSLGLCNNPALLLCSRVALTPGQHPKLGPAPVCSGRLSAFRRSSDQNGCSWRKCSSASGLFTAKAHASARPGACVARQVVGDTRFYLDPPDYRWKTLIPARAFIGPGVLLTACH